MANGEREASHARSYVVMSPAWDGGSAAATWGSGTSGVSGAVAATNCLVGASAGDAVSSGGVTALSNGNYVVDSPALYGATNGLGAVTWGAARPASLGPSRPPTASSDPWLAILWATTELPP